MNALLERVETAEFVFWLINWLIQITVIAGLAIALAWLARWRAVLAHGLLLCGLALIVISPLSTRLMPRHGLQFFHWPPNNSESELATNEWPEFATDDGSMVDETALTEQDFLTPIRSDLTTGDQPDDLNTISTSSWMPTMLKQIRDSFRPVALGIVASLSIWFVGVAVLTVRFARGWMRLRALLRASDPVRNPRHLKLLREVTQASGLGRLPEFSESKELSGPVAAGVLRPRVIVPKGFLQNIQTEDLDSLLRHELAHLARRDQLELLLQHVVAIGFWFHPLVHALNYRLTRSREEICDNHALSETDGPSFSRTLLRIAELAPCQNTSLSLPLMTSRWTLESRISGILDERRNTMTRCSARDITLIYCCAIAFVTLASMFTFVQASANSTAVAMLPAQDAKVDQCEVAFMAKTSVLLKSEFVKQSGLLPRDPKKQPEGMLLFDSVSVRGVLSLSDDFSKLANHGPNHIDYYIEFTLKSNSKESSFHEYVQQQIEKDSRFKLTREEDGAIYYFVEPDTVTYGGEEKPRIVVPGYQIVFDGKRITVASESFEYDTRNLPALTDNANKLLKTFSGSDGFLVFDIQGANRLIESGLRAAKQEMPPFVPYFEMLERMNWAAVSVEMDDAALFTVQAECEQIRDAGDLTKMVEDLVTMALENNQGIGPNAEMNSKILDTIKVTTRGREVVASIEVTEEAAQKARLAADETLLMNNQRQAALSFHNFESAYGGLPFHAREGQSDELSWRVRVLPYLEEMELYERFDLSQSWDSAKNLGIMETTPMPKIFGGIEVFGEMGTKTNLCWVKSNVKVIGDIKNGTSNTICFVYSDKYVNWTENNDVTPAEVMAQFKALKPGEYLMASFYDGSVRKIPADMDPEEFAKMLDPGADE